MSTPWKPEGYSSVSPYLVVADAAATIAFLQRTFAASLLHQVPAADGKIMHAEIRLDDSIIMLADGGDGFPVIPAHVHVYVADVDARYQQALTAGATSVQAPVQKEDADKRCGVKDSGGTTWWIGTRTR